MKHKEKGYLLDTCTLSILQDKSDQAYDKTVAALKDFPPEADQWLCPITIGELAFGVAMVEWKLGKTTSVLRTHLAEAMTYKIVKMNRKTAKLYGELKGKLAENSSEYKAKVTGQTKGKPPKLARWTDAIDKEPFGISENDIWIAAAALQQNLTLVSNDGDFKTIKKYWPKLKVVVIEPVVEAKAVPAPAPTGA